MASSSTLTPTQAEARPLRAYLVLAMGIAAVALAAILIRLALNQGVPALVVAASRLVLATLMLTPLTLSRYSTELRRLKRREITLLVISGLFLAVHFAAWVSSLQYTSVLISGVLVVTTPIWAGLLEVFVLKSRLTVAIIVGLVVALAGSIIIAIPSNGVSATPFDDTALLGGGLALLGAMTVAVYMIIGRVLRPTLSLLPYIWAVYGTAALVLSLVVLLNRLPVVGYAPAAYLWMLLLAIFPQLIGHSSLNYALGYLPATYVSIATQIEPILSAVVAFFLFSESPGWAQVAGSAVIMIGVALATLNPNFSRRKVKTID
jgi:drug/metabolite transporter (DMT)-like permease